MQIGGFVTSIITWGLDSCNWKSTSRTAETATCVFLTLPCPFPCTWCVSVGLKSFWRNCLGMLSWHNRSPEGRGLDPPWFYVPALSFAGPSSHLKHFPSWIISLDGEENRWAGMAFWDLCELNQLAERFECQCSKHEKAWGCGWEQGREELGWGEESETSPFGSSKQLDVISWRWKAARVSTSSVGLFLVGLFLLCHANSPCGHPASWTSLLIWLKTSPTPVPLHVWKNFSLRSKVVLLCLQVCCTGSCDGRSGGEGESTPSPWLGVLGWVGSVGCPQALTCGQNVRSASSLHFSHFQPAGVLRRKPHRPG